MEPETERRIESLDGKVLALQTSIRALIACHPHPLIAIATVTAQLDEMTGMALSTQLPDDLVNALVQTQENLLPTDIQIENSRSC